MKYLVAVKQEQTPADLKPKNAIFQFDTKEERQEFIEDLEREVEGVEYAIAEISEPSIKE